MIIRLSPQPGGYAGPAHLSEVAPGVELSTGLSAPLSRPKIPSPIKHTIRGLYPYARASCSFHSAIARGGRNFLAV